MTHYDLQQAMQAQSALRTKAGLAEELFDEEQFVGMLSDEIRILRETGSTDADIAAVLKTNANVEIDASTITKYYRDTTEWRQ